MTKPSSKTKKDIFPLDYYDKDFCLKVNFLTMAVMLICCKTAVISFIALLAHGGKEPIIQFFFYNKTTLIASLAAMIPTIIVLIAWAKRHAKAHKIIRVLWRYGKFFLLTTTILNMAINIYSIRVRPWADGVDVVRLILDSLCLFYILRSKLLNAVFKDFPQTLESK